MSKAQVQLFLGRLRAAGLAVAEAAVDAKQALVERQMTALGTELKTVLDATTAASTFSRNSGLLTNAIVDSGLGEKTISSLLGIIGDSIASDGRRKNGKCKTSQACSNTLRKRSGK